MVVQIKSFDSRKGQGIAIDPAGNEIEFSYKKLANEVRIPDGGKAEFIGSVLHPVGRFKSCLFYIFKLIEWSKKHANIFK